MRKDIFLAAIGLVLFVAGVPLQSSAQGDSGYTFLTGTSVPMVCVGRWVPSTDRALPGNCEGQLMDLGQFSAASAKASADRLDQAIDILMSIDQRLAINNNNLQSLSGVIVNLQKLIDRQAAEVSLSETIARRFDSLPGEVLSNDLFRQEITKLKEDILKEVERRYPAKPSTPAK
ncbi:MAG: hypothetical protein ACLPN1_16520 [Dissulfurispiraceae bacterium]|jgi:hypothetical protein